MRYYILTIFKIYNTDRALRWSLRRWHLQVVNVATFGSKKMRVSYTLHAILLLNYLALPSRVLAMRLVAFGSLVA